MGSVKRDIKKNERTYSNVTLSDKRIVELLIRSRYKLHPSQYSSDSFYDVSSRLELNEEIISIYASLDKLIEKIEWTDEQKYVLSKVLEGYEYDQIDGIGHRRVREVMRQVTKKIVEENNYDWKVYAKIVFLEEESKQCSVCERWLPSTTEFFSPDRDFLRTTCKKCRSKGIKN